MGSVTFFKNSGPGGNGAFSISTTASTPEQFIDDCTSELVAAMSKFAGDEDFTVDGLLPLICQTWAMLGGKSNKANVSILIGDVDEHGIVGAPIRGGGDNTSLGELLEQAEGLARQSFGGHLTIMRFTGEWKAAFGTPDLDSDHGRAQVWRLDGFSSLRDAVQNLVEQEPCFDELKPLPGPAHLRTTKENRGGEPPRG
jgi:hypothetical protein